MDLRIVLGIMGVIAAVIITSRLLFAVFSLGLGNYALLTPILIIVTVMIVVVLMIKKFLKEQSFG